MGILTDDLSVRLRQVAPSKKLTLAQQLERDRALQESWENVFRAIDVAEAEDSLRLKRSAEELRIEDWIIREFDLAADLHAELQERQPREAKTYQKYGQRIRRFQRWAFDKGWDAAPYSEAVAALYFVEQSLRGVSIGQIRMECAALRFFHRQAGLESPTDGPFVRVVMRKLVAISGTPRQEPLPPRRRRRHITRSNHHG
jgi:hypothetical protein